MKMRPVWVVTTESGPFGRYTDQDRALGAAADLTKNRTDPAWRAANLDLPGKLFVTVSIEWEPVPFPWQIDGPSRRWVFEAPPAWSPPPGLIEVFRQMGVAISPR